MKNRIGVIICVLVCVGLAVALITIKKQAAEQQNSDAKAIQTFSNNFVEASGKLEEQKQVAAMLDKDLDAQKKSLDELTNNYEHVSTDLIKTQAKLAETQTEFKEEVAKRDAKINELEAQNEALDKQALDLSTSITNLTTQIADTQQKLAAAEGDKGFLQGELKRMMAEKAELERQFNDISVLRAQVSKLREQIVIARRLEWSRLGILASADQKGAQKLLQGLSAPQVARIPKPAYDLNVEVSADGSVKVLPPLTNGSAGSVPTVK